MNDLSARFSYQNVNSIAKNPAKAMSSDTPTLVRLDITYGSGSASQWLYRVLQPMFMFLGVNSDKFPKEMVYDLASTVANNQIYNKLTLAEVMIFISRFKSGQYGRFYGDTSYVLTFMEALKAFWGERASYYEQAERESKERSEAVERGKSVTYEEWKAMKEAKGEKVNVSVTVAEDRGRKARVYNPVETMADQAKDIITNRYNLSTKSILDIRKVFRGETGMTPEEFIEKSDKGGL